MRPQRVLLDRRRALSYIAACACLAGCRSRPAPLVPEPLAPADGDSAVAWARATLPAHHTAIRFRWKYEDDQKRWGGRGQARIAPPDSLRFDYVGPLGLGAGAAAVVADSAIWADPEKNFRSLVPAVRMLWAGLGIVRPPAPNAAVFSRGGGGAGGAGGGADDVASTAVTMPVEETYHVARERLLAEFERRYLTWLVAQAGNNISRAARIAAVDRTTLYRLMERHGLQRAVSSSPSPSPDDE